MSRVTDARLASWSAVALLVGAGTVGMANSFASSALGASGVDLSVLRLCSTASLLSAFCVGRFMSKRFPLWDRLGIALWGLLLLEYAATAGKYATTGQAEIVFPVFMMMVIVWLGLTSPRGVERGVRTGRARGLRLRHVLAAALSGRLR